MDIIDYAVVIRTTGNAHEKYQRLLDSIDRLIPRPKEVIVVLPEGYALPQERLGYELFFFAPKGMVSQRLAGVNRCSARYALLCDDDVCFGQDFVQKLYAPLCQGLGAISAGPLYSFLPAGFLHAAFDCVRGAACPTIWHRDRYVSVLKTTGYSYNRHLDADIRYYESQSVAGTCFFVDADAFRRVELEDETWIDANGYAGMEDQTMIYKAWLRGYKTVVAADAEYEHLDAKTSTRTKNLSVPYSLRFNRYVFWHRFLYQQQSDAFGRLWCRVAFGYRRLWDRAYDAINCLRGRISKEEYRVSCAGWKDAIAFVSSPEYRSLPPVTGN